MPDINGSYYADAATPMSVATITATMATAEDARINAFATDSGWVTLTLVNGYTVASSRTPQVRRIGKCVYLRGQVAGGSGAICTLPSGYRPATMTHIFPIASASEAYMQISTSGVVTPSGGGTFWSLAGVTFLAD